MTEEKTVAKKATVKKTPAKALNLEQKLVEIRKQVEYIKKEGKGAYGDFATGSAIIGGIRGKMDELNVTLTPNLMKRELTQVIEKTKSGERNLWFAYFEIDYVWKDADSGEEKTVPWLACDTKDSPAQAMGSALTFSERYFLYKQFQVATDKDDPDLFDAKIHPETQTITKDQRAELMATMNSCGLDGPKAKEIIAKFGYDKSTDILQKDHKKIIDKMIEMKPAETQEKKEGK